MVNCTCGTKSNELLVSLNPSETLIFDDDKKARMQLFATLSDGHSFASNLEYINVYPLYVPPEQDPSLVQDGYMILDGGNIVNGV